MKYWVVLYITHKEEFLWQPFKSKEEAYEHARYLAQNFLFKISDVVEINVSIGKNL
jgi:hypothetical protein